MMRLKSYFADTVESALALAAQEMGEDAMLVYSRDAPAEARALGRYEVVFAATPGPAPVQNGTGTRRETAPAMDAPAEIFAAEQGPLQLGPLDTSPEPQALARRIDGGEISSRSLAARWMPSPETGVTELVLDSAGEANDAIAWPDDRVRGRQPDEGRAPDEADAGTSWSLRLRQQDVEPSLAALVVREARRTEGTASVRRPAIAHAAAARLRCHRGESGPGRITILAGPPGSGKSTSLVKLAFLYAAAEGQPLRLVSLDNKRPLAAEQLRRYAQLLGSRFAFGATRQEIRQLFRGGHQTGSDNEYTIVDMPGCAAYDNRTFEYIQEALALIPDAELHLVLSAATRTADLMDAVESFSALRPDRLLFTHLDETRRLGGVFTAAARTNLPISYLCDGPSVPDGIRDANTEDIAELMTKPGEPAAITLALAPQG
ncbi:MAG: hypothetical protein R2729_15715 [Bryobacteraceae bacterium]